jgi:hypothetical protein
LRSPFVFNRFIARLNISLPVAPLTDRDAERFVHPP